MQYIIKSFEAVKLAWLEQPFYKLVQITCRYLLGSQSGSVDVAKCLRAIVFVAHDTVQSSKFMDLGPNALVVAEVHNG
jgi:hypothetical protein